MSSDLYWTWYSVAEFVEGPQPIQEMLVKHPWTRDFLLPVRSGVSYEAPMREFSINPIQTIIVLRRFAVKLRCQEIAVHLCKTSKYPATFIQICKEIMQRIDQARAGATTNADSLPGLATTGSTSHTPRAKDHPSRKDDSSVPDEVVAVLEQHRLTCGQFYAKSDDHSIKEVVDGVLRGEYELGDDDFQKEVESIASDMEDAKATMHFNQHLSDLEKVYRDGVQPSSQLLIHFAYNVYYFTGNVTGLDGAELGPAREVAYFWKLMSETEVARSQQFNPIYAEIRQLRSIVEQQNQIITSLEYRRLLENLPNKVHYDRALKLTHANQKTGTRYWKAAWQDLVEEETRLMILAKTAPTRQKRPLTELFEYNFNLWWQNNKAATRVPDSTFKVWPAYARGEALYGELSSNIHQHDTRSGNPYDVKPSNWSRSDRLILATVRPEEKHIIIDSEGVMDVEWNKERTRHGLK